MQYIRAGDRTLWDVAVLPPALELRHSDVEDVAATLFWEWRGVWLVRVASFVDLSVRNSGATR
jgi:hypothetical protein